MMPAPKTACNAYLMADEFYWFPVFELAGATAFGVER